MPALFESVDPPSSRLCHTLQTHPHGDKAELRETTFDELHVVDRTLARLGMDRDAEFFRQNLRERCAIDVIYPARRSRPQGQRLWPIGVGGWYGCRGPNCE
jgi:hypothetical protein